MELTVQWMKMALPSSTCTKSILGANGGSPVKGWGWVGVGKGSPLSHNLATSQTGLKCDHRVKHRCLQPSSPAIPWRMKVALLVRVMLPLLEVTLMLCVPGGSVEVLRGKEQGTAGPWSNEHWAPKSGMLEAQAVVFTSVGEGKH